jgi:hypothetical protein
VRQLLNGESGEAVRTAEEVLRNPQLPDYLVTQPVLDLVAALRRRGEADRALAELDRRLAGSPATYPPAVQPLLLERARVRASRAEWEAAEKDVAAFLDHLDPAQWVNAAPPRSEAHTIRGFIREGRGDAPGAQEAWREALKLIRGTPAMVTCEGFLLASLTNDLTEADVAFFIDQTTRRLGIPAATFIRKGGTFEPAWVAAVMRNAWRNPRGREYARRIALDDLPYMDVYGIHSPSSSPRRSARGRWPARRARSRRR